MFTLYNTECFKILNKAIQITFQHNNVWAKIVGKVRISNLVVITD